VVWAASFSLAKVVKSAVPQPICNRLEAWLHETAEGATTG